MKNLQEEILKIKQKMKMIMENDFSANSVSSEQWELNSIVMHVLADWAENMDFSLIDYDVNLDSGFFALGGKDDRYMLTYTFDVNITAHAWFSRGSYDEAPDGEGTQYEFKNMNLEIVETTEQGEKVIYNGPDFSDFENQKFFNEKTKKTMTGFDILFDYFDDTINELDIDSRGNGDW
jgi:hypothetical protein